MSNLSIIAFNVFLLLSELQAQNDDTLNKIYDTQNTIDASRESLLLDRAGVAPRMYHFDMDSVCYLNGSFQ